ncbi:hypothetical protein [Halovulum marinum]|uniref:hypothetical protein n=1 Tax=Halovulum marinum TaxID=2662447 RepID=UPI0012B1C676|nr:hypothetical protein [Halovulum marinum]
MPGPVFGLAPLAALLARRPAPAGHVGGTARTMPAHLVLLVGVGIFLIGVRTTGGDD